ncbi:aldo/keto reductase [Williamsia sp. SKLECPSW1]
MTLTSALPHTNPFSSRARIGFGTMRLEHLLDAGDREGATALVRAAVDAGADHLDTAFFYGAGEVNAVIRDAIRRDDDVLVVTKVGAERAADGSLRPAQRPEDLRASVERNLESLGVDRLDVVNLRRLDTRHGIRADGDQVVGVDDQLAALVELRDRGVIGAIGVSGVTLDGLRRAVPAGVVCVQNAYNLLVRDDDDQLTLCAEEGIAWIPFFPLGGAIGMMPSVVDDAVVRAVATETGHTPAQVGLAWLLQHSPVTRLIPGTADADHLRANVAAAQVVLSPDQMARLEAVGGV